jgi:hypothetical protein
MIAVRGPRTVFVLRPVALDRDTIRQAQRIVATIFERFSKDFQEITHVLRVSPFAERRKA